MERRSVNSLGMFDAIKGMFVVFMLFGHSFENVTVFWDAEVGRSGLTLLSYGLYKIFSCCMIPMFFMICGYGFRKTSMKKAIAGQVKFVWKPYLILALTVTVISIAKKVITGGDVWEGICFQGLPYLMGVCPAGIYFGMDMDSIGPVWFVVTFVLSGILLNAILQEEKKWMQLLLTIMAAAVGVTLREYRIPFCVQQSLICTLYMYVGWQMKKSKFLNNQMPKYFWILACAYICFSAYFGEIEVSANRWKNGLADVLAGVLGGGALLVLMLRLNRFNGIVMRSIRWLGQQVMNFCIIHSAFYVTIPWEKVAEKCGGSTKIAAILALILYATTGVGGCWLLETIQRKRAGRMREA